MKWNEEENIISEWFRSRFHLAFSDGEYEWETQPQIRIKSFYFSFLLRPNTAFYCLCINFFQHQKPNRDIHPKAFFSVSFFASQFPAPAKAPATRTILWIKTLWNTEYEWKSICCVAPSNRKAIFNLDNVLLDTKTQFTA